MKNKSITSFTVNETIALLEKPPKELWEIPYITRGGLLMHLACIASGIYNVCGDGPEAKTIASEFLSANT